MGGEIESFYAKHDNDTIIHALSIRLAKQLREMVQGAFREEEWHDIDAEFYRRILAGFVEYNAGTRQNAALQLTHHN